MRIATFNLENLGEARHSDRAVAERIAVLRPQLERLDADVVCIQEVNGPKDAKSHRRTLAPLDQLVATTPYAAYHRAATRQPGGTEPMDRHNLAVLSRWPIRESRQVFHDLVPALPWHLLTAAEGEHVDPLVRWDRPLLHAVIALPGGRPLHVLNLHLRAPLAVAIEGRKSGPFAWTSSASWAEGFYLAGLKRAGQALEARLVVERIFDEDAQALVLVAGDFNAEAGETPTRILQADTEDTGSGHLAVRSLVALERSLPDSQRFSVIHAGQRLMLDHLLASRGLLAAYRGLEIHNEALSDELVAYSVVDASPESYHAPVVASFALG